MSYFVCYCVSETGPPVDGEDVASTSGWAAWGEWVLDRHEEFPEAAHLAQEGWLDEGQPGSLDALDDELERMTHDVTDADLAGVTAQLLAALRARPAGTVGIIVTDGEPAGDEVGDADEEPE